MIPDSNRIYINSKKTNHSIKIDKILTDIWQQMYGYPKATWKDVQHSLVIKEVPFKTTMNTTAPSM